MLWCYIAVDVFFFFKQKTAYECRISDWSSDVCSSDLLVGIGASIAFGHLDDAEGRDLRRSAVGDARADPDEVAGGPRVRERQQDAVGRLAPGWRSEERRVGKECVSTCRSRRSPSP